MIGHLHTVSADRTRRAIDASTRDGSRPMGRARLACLGSGHVEVTQRLALEREARRQRLLGRMQIEDPRAAKALPGRFVLSKPPPATVSRESAMEWTQLGLADAKLALFSSGSSLYQKYGSGAFACRKSATQALASLRTLAAPPILARQAQRLQGIWFLVETSRPELFGTRALSDVSQGLETARNHSNLQVNVRLVMRIVPDGEQYSQTTLFCDEVTGRAGAFTEFGTLQVGLANVLDFTPTRFCLTIGADETEIHTASQAARRVALGYLDDDLMVDGAHTDDFMDMHAWGRDHHTGLRNIGI